MRFQLLLVIICMTFLSISFAQSVEQFTQYNVSYTFLEEGVIEVNKFMLLRNIHSVGIVPGPVEFRTSVLEGNEFEIFDLQATNRHGENLTSRILEFSEYTAIGVNVFTPILPGFEYEINLNYKIRLNNTPGILFKRVQLPLVQQTRVPILAGNIEINVPNNHFITHTNFRDNFTTISSNTITFELTDETPEYVLIEYSRVPSRIGGFAGSLVFWILVNAVLFSILIYEIVRGFRRKKN